MQSWIINNYSKMSIGLVGKIFAEWFNIYGSEILEGRKNDR
jgi:hypothetical protein